MSEYHRLDFNKLSFSNDVISYEEVLENATPLKITNDIISGLNKVTVTKAEKDYDNKCVKLEIFC